MSKLTIITGGQTGVDTGALRAALAQGVLARCIMPAGHRREEGAPPWLLDITGCCTSDKYDLRTKEVIKAAEACLVIAPDIESTPGTKLTVRLARDEGLQLWIFRSVQDRAFWKAEAHAVAYWVAQLRATYPVLTLMVAGPRGSKWRAGEDAALTIMEHVLTQHKELR